ncbi:MAG: hypothetical protein RLZZ210_205 [Pseudomonadota bacterium]|jgi:uncharacterized protein (TIGR00369 family)
MNNKPYPLPNPFLEYIGAKFIDANNTECVLELDITPNLVNSWGSGHGGMLVTLMDVSMSWASRFYLDEPKGAVTLELKSSFFAPAHGLVKCVGKVVHKTATLAFCESEVYDERNTLVCKASATFKYMKRS